MTSTRFAVAAATVAAADASDQTVLSFPTSTEVAYVPRYVVIAKAAGTAYSAATGELELRSDDGAIWATLNVAGFLDSALAQVRAVRANDGGAYTDDTSSLALRGTGTITAAAASPGLTITVYYDQLILK